MRKLLLLWIALCLFVVVTGCVATVPDVPLADAQTSNANLLNMDWEEQTTEISIEGDTTGNNFMILYHSLLPGQTYTFSLGSTAVTQGNASEFTVLAYDSKELKIIEKTNLKIGEGGVFSFTIPQDANTSMLIVYAGPMGKTMGNSLVLREVKLEEGTVATQWKAYGFQDDNLLIGAGNYDPRDFTLKRNETNAANNMRLHFSLEPDTLYRLSFEDIKIIDGSADIVSVIVFDNTNKKACLRNDFSIGQSGTWDFTTPSEVDPEYQLVIFSGEMGNAQSAGIEVQGAVLNKQE